jgi:hypothetical protein
MCTDYIPNIDYALLYIAEHIPCMLDTLLSISNNPPPYARACQTHRLEQNSSKSAVGKPLVMMSASWRDEGT